MSIFEDTFDTKHKNPEEAQRDSEEYQKQKEIAAGDDTKKRMSLAKSTATNREILYYLAEQDPDPEIRKAVIQNDCLPVQASKILAEDEDQDVRLALAGRLVELLPDLDEDKHSQLYAFAVQALGTLALDEVIKIRKALSSTLKDHAHTPPKIAGQLARDIEREVSEPILRFCAALPDEDLLDILKNHPDDWVVETVAQREEVSEEISEAVIETESVTGGAALIKNEGASITKSLLNIIIEKAKSFPEWQKPMAIRKSLPTDIAKQLAEFADGAVKNLLLNREDFDAETMDEISEVFKRRIDFEEGDQTPEDRLEKLIKQKALGEDAISDAVGMRDYDFVKLALAYLARTDVATVSSIFKMKAPKPIIALSWKAGMSMRMALQLQKDIGQVQPDEILYPKDGKDYPLTQDEMNWQLEFLGIKAA